MAKDKAADIENKKMFRARFDTFILSAIDSIRDGGSYGYEIEDYIVRKTQGHYKSKSISTVYNALKRLEEQGLVIETPVDPNSPLVIASPNASNRNYYALTEKGKSYLERQKLEYRYLRTMLDNLLTDEKYDLSLAESPVSTDDLKPLTKRSTNKNNPYDFDESVDEEELPDLTEDDSNTYSIDYVDKIMSQTKEEVEPIKQEPIKVEEPIEEPKQEKYIYIQDQININEPVIETTDYPSYVTHKKISIYRHKYDYNSFLSHVLEPIFTKDFNSTKVDLDEKPFIKDEQEEEDSIFTNHYKPEQLEFQIGENNSEVTLPEVNSSNDSLDLDYISKLHTQLKSDGYFMTSYKISPQVLIDNSDVKYIYLTKILRDAISFTSIYTVLMSIILYAFSSTFNFGLGGFLTCIIISLLCIGGICALWYKTSNKYIRDTINIKLLNICTGIAFFIIFVIIIVIGLIAPNGYSLNSIKIYSPAFIALSIPLFGLIFSLLHKYSKSYFKTI